MDLHEVFDFGKAVGVVGYIINKTPSKRIFLRQLYNFIYLLDRKSLLTHGDFQIGDSYYLKYMSFVPRIINNLFNWHDSQSFLWHKYFNTSIAGVSHYAYIMHDPGTGELSQFVEETLDNLWEEYVKRSNISNDDDYMTDADFLATFPEYRSLLILGTTTDISVEDILKFNHEPKLLEGYKKNLEIKHEMSALATWEDIHDYLTDSKVKEEGE